MRKLFLPVNLCDKTADEHIITQNKCYTSMRMSQSVLINWKMVLDWIDSLFHFNDNWSLFIVRVVVGCLACSSFVVRRVVVVGVLHLKLNYL